MAGGRGSASRPWSQAGKGWLELGVVAALLAVFSAVLIAIVQDYQAMAEKATVKLTIMNMRTGMRYRIAELILDGRTPEIARLVGANPVTWLERPPAGYLGEIEGPVERDRVPHGSWYFDRGERELVYRVNWDARFPPDENGRKEIRLKSVAGYESSTDRALLGVALRVRNNYD